MSEIGQYVVDADLLRDDAAVKEKLERIVELQSRINASKELVENIRKASLCPNCGAVLEPDVNFCPQMRRQPLADTEPESASAGHLPELWCPAGCRRGILRKLRAESELIS